MGEAPLDHDPSERTLPQAVKSARYANLPVPGRFSPGAFPSRRPF